MPTLAIRIFLAGLLLAGLTGCDRAADRQAAPPAVTQKPTPSPTQGCTACHPFTLDTAHSFGCPGCHGGDPAATTAEAAHANLIELPAHPANMRAVCGRCHARETEAVAGSLHFTLAREVNSVRRAFGANQDLPSLLAIPVTEPPTTPLALADDMLRRRCLRCHPYYQGDPYPETEHGTGCAACHLDFGDTRLESHAFVRFPADDQCLHCHYGNTVGADYYGRFERDFSWEYRTPYRLDDVSPRPYGVEYHQLAPDVHQRAGMACIDCHDGGQLMDTAHGKATLSCAACHDWRPGRPLPAANLTVASDQLILITRRDGKRLPVPTLTDPAHRAYQDKATCVACHAQWSFNDHGQHLLRQDTDDYDPWTFLTVQGCYEVEASLENGLAGEEDGPPAMIDKLTGDARPGLWLKGYELRRWEEPLLCRDDAGRLTVCRPSLDLHLSFLNADQEVLFDAVTPVPGTRIIRPYTPHTTGKAGAFFRQRLQNFIQPGKKP